MENFKQKLENPIEAIMAEKLTDEKKEEYAIAMNYLAAHDKDWYDKNLGRKAEKRILGSLLEYKDVLSDKEAEEKIIKDKAIEDKYGHVPIEEYKDYEKKYAKVADEYEIPREVYFGIACAENGKINRFNLGAVDSNPKKAIKFDDENSGAISAAKFLSGKANVEFYGNGQKGKEAFEKAWDNRDNPEKMLKLIEAAGYAGNPKTWKQRSIDQDPENGAGLIYNSWSEFIMAVNGWKKWSS